MKVLVLGASGYCGQPICEVLNQKGFSIVAFDKTIQHAKKLSNVHYVKGDVTKINEVSLAAKDCSAIVLSILSRQDVESESLGIIEGFHVNVGGSLVAFEAARQLGINQVVVLSSGRVVWDYYQKTDLIQTQPPLQIDQNTPLNFSDHYGLTKKLQEDLCKYYADTFISSVIVLRPWWVVDASLGTNRYGQALGNDTVLLSPAGMIDRFDLGEAVALALKQPEIPFEIFHLAAGPGSEKYFDLNPIKNILGWHPKHRFNLLASKGESHD